MNKRDKKVTTTVSEAEKAKWKEALQWTVYDSLAEYVREVMTATSDMVLSIGNENEMEVALSVIPRRDGQITPKVEGTVNFRGDYE